MKKRIARLAAMPTRELAYRAGEKLRSELERLGLGREAPRAPRGYLYGAQAGRFYRSIRDSFVEPSWIARAIEEADAICGRRSEIDWHCDPVTGARWEQRFWADYRPVED